MATMFTLILFVTTLNPSRLRRIGPRRRRRMRQTAWASAWRALGSAPLIDATLTVRNMANVVLVPACWTTPLTRPRATRLPFLLAKLSGVK
jgi:hypothetical protein